MSGVAQVVCQECAYQGAPIEFDLERAAREFREGVRGPAGHEISAREAVDKAVREGERDAAEARAQPTPDLHEFGTERDLVDRMRLVPLVAFTGSGAFLLLGVAGVFLGLLGLVALVLGGRGNLVTVLATLVWPWLFVFIGLALLKIGLRGWRRAAAP